MLPVSTNVSRTAPPPIRTLKFLALSIASSLLPAFFVPLARVQRLVLSLGVFNAFEAFRCSVSPVAHPTNESKIWIITQWSSNNTLGLPGNTTQSPDIGADSNTPSS